MKLVTAATPYGLRVGAVEPDGIVDLNAAEVMRHQSNGLDHAGALAAAERSVPADMMYFLDAGPAAMDGARKALAFAAGLDHARAPWYDAELPLGPVVPRPQKLFVMRGNYIRHRIEMGPRLGTKAERPERPRYFLKPPTTVIGHGQCIVYPKLSHEVHHEVELAVVIGTGGRWIPQDQVESHLAGYTILLDITARDLSGKDDRNKSFDTFGPIGPCLVPPADLGDPNDLSLKLWVNGELRQDGSTNALEYKIPEIVSFISQAITLCPGDVISTGTPEGVGPIEPGDTVEAEIDGIGRIRCPVVAENGPARR